MQKQRQTDGKGLDVWGDAWKDKKQAKKDVTHSLPRGDACKLLT